MDHYDYFKKQEHDPDEVTMDEFIAEAMRTDLKFKGMEQELNYEHSARITLKNEVLTCYSFLKENNLLLKYKSYRDGE